MVFLYILLGIILLFALIFSLFIKAEIIYRNESGFGLKAGAGPVMITVTPKKKKEINLKDYSYKKFQKRLEKEKKKKEKAALKKAKKEKAKKEAEKLAPDSKEKDTGKMAFKAGVVEGVLYDAAGIEAIADIPSRDELIAKFMGSIQSPVGKFVRTLQAIADAQGAPAEAAE